MAPPPDAAVEEEYNLDTLALQECLVADVIAAVDGRAPATTPPAAPTTPQAKRRPARAALAALATLTVVIVTAKRAAPRIEAVLRAFVRITAVAAFFAAYLARAAARWVATDLLGAIRAVTHQARARVGLEWAHAKERAAQRT
jgi:hypothetical protein